MLLEYWGVPENESRGLAKRCIKLLQRRDSHQKWLNRFQRVLELNLQSSQERMVWMDLRVRVRHLHRLLDGVGECMELEEAIVSLLSVTQFLADWNSWISGGQ